MVKTFTVRYKCCYGFKRTEGSPGCDTRVELKPLLQTIEEVEGKEFIRMISSSSLEDKCKNENLTIFVPSDLALNDFTEKMLEMVRSHQNTINYQRVLSSISQNQNIIQRRTKIELIFFP